MSELKLQHFIDIKQLSASGIETLLAQANESLNNLIIPNKTSTKLKGKLIANLFFEPSTRTCNSFEIAAKRLGALTIAPNTQTSSLLKGETLLDMIRSIRAMGATSFVVRHQENGLMRWLTEQLANDTHLINAGEGWQQHPTQALLDLMTIQQHHSDWSTLRIAIIGDLRHSRVASSLIDALLIMQAADIRLIAPARLQPKADFPSHVTRHSSLPEGIADTDAVVCLRLQKERMDNEHSINESEFQQRYCLTEKVLQKAKPDVIVMHPGPMNRGIEITSEVADGPHSVILRQVKNGIAVRIAVLQALVR